jgi:hypothetical protein
MRRSRVESPLLKTSTPNRVSKTVISRQAAVWVVGLLALVVLATLHRIRPGRESFAREQKDAATEMASGDDRSEPVVNFDLARCHTITKILTRAVSMREKFLKADFAVQLTAERSIKVNQLSN